MTGENVKTPWFLLESCIGLFPSPSDRIYLFIVLHKGY
jgi:hypothetical protein